MRALVLLTVVVAARAAPQSPLGYAFVAGDDQTGGEWNQMEQRDGNTYRWGYETPSQVHYERKDDTGEVEGSFGYVDANGEPVVWVYNSQPEVGFTVDVATGQAVQRLPAELSEPVEPVVAASRSAVMAVEEEAPVEVEEVPAVVLAVEEGTPVEVEEVPAVEEETPVDNAFGSPLLKQAAEVGHITLDIDSAVVPGAVQYTVSEDFTNEAGSVSAVAANLNAFPIAAVHDVRGPPRFRDVSAARDPVLLHRDVDGSVQFALLVPVQ